MKITLNLRHAVALFLAVFAFAFGTVSAANADNPVPRILVTGEGSVDLAPDMAVLTLTVTRQAETARAALDANSSAMRDVQTAMRTKGIEARDLQTSGFLHSTQLFLPATAIVRQT